MERPNFWIIQVLMGYLIVANQRELFVKGVWQPNHSRWMCYGDSCSKVVILAHHFITKERLSVDRVTGIPFWTTTVTIVNYATVHATDHPHIQNLMYMYYRPIASDIVKHLDMRLLDTQLFTKQ